MIEPVDFLVSCLQQLPSTFRPGEMAYLALTSKAEHPFRDKLAFSLYERLPRDRYIVSREWTARGAGGKTKRVDLAVLNPTGRPVCLLELKAMYSFDVAEKYAARTEADEIDALSSAEDCPTVLSLLLATHPKGEIPRSLRGVIKYDSGINSARRKLGSHELVRENVVKSVACAYGQRQPVFQGNFDAGSAFGFRHRSRDDLLACGSDRRVGLKLS